MSDEETLSRDKQMVLAYLYGEMDAEQKVSFEKRIGHDSELKALLTSEQKFDQLFPSGLKPVIDERRENAVHWSLGRRLRRSKGAKISLSARLGNLWQSQISFKFQLTSMLLAFVVGIIVAQPSFMQEPVELVLVEKSERALPLEMIENDDFEIIDLQLSRKSPDSDEVDVRYSLVSETQVSGSLSSQKMQNLFAATMKNDVNDATRLDLVDLLKDYSQSAQAREALSYSLLNDPNPGVRMVAAQSLAKLSHDASVREVLRSALQADLNAGIRVEVFEALIQHLDDQATMDTFKNYSTKDSNPYIRAQAESLVRNATAVTPSEI